MSNRRGYGSGYGSNYQGNRGGNFGGGGSGLGGINPWQSGNTPQRSGAGNVQSLLASSNLLNQLAAPDSQLALATKLLSSIIPMQQQQPQQPPSLLSLNSNYGGGGGGMDRFGYPDLRFRRDDRRDNYRNRRPINDRKGDKSRSKSKVSSGKDSKKTEDDNSAEGKDKDDDRDEEKMETDEEGKPKEGGKDKEEGPLPAYEGIPEKLLHCHVCNKNMWNDVSYDTHIKGRNHRIKLQELEEDYQLQTNLMRQIAALSLKLDELRRGGKRRPYPEQYCKMCDLHFNGMSMFAHRSTEEHQTLKKFIHPTCEICKKDFQVRIEYDEHLLTPDHLQVQTKVLARKKKYDDDPKVKELKQNQVYSTSKKHEAANVGEKGDIVLKEEDEKLIKSLMEDKSAPLPEYDPDVETPPAIDNVVEQTGFYCKLCDIFLKTENVVDTHCRTMRHFNRYIAHLKEEATKKHQAEEEIESQKRKSETGEENEDNWKRRKSEVNGDDKYDPDQTMEDNASEVEAKEEEAEAVLSSQESVEEEKPKSRTNVARRGRTPRARK